MAAFTSAVPGFEPAVATMPVLVSTLVSSAGAASRARASAAGLLAVVGTAAVSGAEADVLDRKPKNSPAPISAPAAMIAIGVETVGVVANRSSGVS